MSNSDAAGNGAVVDTWLMSPSINAAGLGTLRLSYRHFYQDIGSDVAAIEVSTTGTGGPWTPVKIYTTTQGAAAAFVSDSVNLDAFVPNFDVRIRFHYTAGWNWWFNSVCSLRTLLNYNNSRQTKEI